MKKPQLKYLFTTTLNLESTIIGQTERGLATDVKLKPNSTNGVHTNPIELLEAWPDTQASGRTREKADEVVQTSSEAVPLKWSGLSGDFIDWTDWAILRRDGVMELDGRATIQTDSKYRIGVIFNGCWDASGTGLFDIDSVRGLVPKDPAKPATAEIQLNLRFEGGQPPPPWVRAEPYSIGYSKEDLRKYARLFRAHFLGIGTLTLISDSQWHATIRVMELAIVEEEVKEVTLEPSQSGPSPSHQVEQAPPTGADATVDSKVASDAEPASKKRIAPKRAAVEQTIAEITAVRQAADAEHSLAPQAGTANTPDRQTQAPPPARRV